MATERKARPAARKNVDSTADVESSGEVEVSDAGASALAGCTSEFNGFLFALSGLKARRRGARSADESDVNQAYRELIGPRQKVWVKEIVAEVAGVTGGVVLGIGATNLVFAPRNIPVGCIAAVSGLLIVGLAAFIRHWPAQ